MEKKKAYVPCRGCEERYIGCHGTCSASKEYRHGIDEANRLKKEAYTLEQDMAACKKTAMCKKKKHR